MPRTRTILLTGLLLAGVYVASPYAALWRLYSALCDGQSGQLADMVDWDSVRAGVKQDIADGVIGMGQPQLIASNKLPPFGAGFVTSIAANVVDRELTPEAIEAMAHNLQQPGTSEPAAVQSPGLRGIDHAFFDGLNGFEVRLHPTGCDPDMPAVRVRMERRGLSWKVVRVWVPQDMVEQVQPRMPRT